MSRRTVTSLAWVLLLSSWIGPGPVRAESDGGAGAETVVFVVRHAERGEDDPDDPGLSEAGRQRAQALARLLSHAGVTHLFASEYRRTVETLEPLAKRSGLEIAIEPARDGVALVKSLRALPRGSVAVVAGHSNTVPGLVQGLGGRVDGESLVDVRGEPALRETEFDRLFVVVLPPEGKAPALTTLDLRFGR